MQRIVTVVVVLVLAASAALAADSLVGEWTSKEGGVKLALREDGTFVLDGDNGKWRRDGTSLTLVDEDGESETYRIELTDGKLVMSGGDLEQTVTFERAVKKVGLGKAIEKAKADAPKGEAKTDAGELSRPPQAALEGVKKFTPKFKGPTKEIKDAEGKYTFKVPEAWTFPQSGQEANARYATVNPGYGPMDTAKHQIVFWQVPVLPSEANKGFKDRVEEGARKLEQLYPTCKREKTEVLEAPNGLIGKVTFSGTVENQFVGSAPVVALVAVRQVKHYYLAATIVSLKDAAGELDEDCLAVLDAAVIAVKDRDPEAERRLVGEWVANVKSKGTSLETYRFNADGTYEWHFESSHSVTVKDRDGNTKAYAGGAAADSERGRYEVRGDTIYFVSNKGEQGSFFQIWSEGGRTFLRVGAGNFVR